MLMECRSRGEAGYQWRVLVDMIGDAFRKGGEFLKKLCCGISGEYYTVQDNSISSTGLII